MPSLLKKVTKEVNRGAEKVSHGLQKVVVNQQLEAPRDEARKAVERHQAIVDELNTLYSEQTKKHTEVAANLQAVQQRSNGRADVAIVTAQAQAELTAAKGMMDAFQASKNQAIELQTAAIKARGDISNVNNTITNVTHDPKAACKAGEDALEVVRTKTKDSETLLATAKGNHKVILEKLGAAQKMIASAESVLLLPPSVPASAVNDLKADFERRMAEMHAEFTRQLAAVNSLSTDGLVAPASTATAPIINNNHFAPVTTATNGNNAFGTNGGLGLTLNGGTLQQTASAGRLTGAFVVTTPAGTYLSANTATPANTARNG